MLDSGKIRNYFIRVGASLFCLFHLYTGGMGILPGFGQRAVHLGFALCMAFLIKPTMFRRRNNEYKKRWRWFELLVSIILISTIIALTIYIIREGPAAIGWRAGIQTKSDFIYGIITIFLVLEATRRFIGPALPLISIISMLYAIFGQHLPGILSHKGFSFFRVVGHLFLGYEGLLGVPLGASANYAALFIIFGALLAAIGGGSFFTDFMTALFGSVRGGPAKVAVVGSALFASISGSAAANVAATGSFTIPLMKKTGYSPEFAGGIEAAASLGGQIMPPVMGASAFIMAEIIGVPYGTIIKYAFIPALLYFYSLFIGVDLQALKNNLKGRPKAELPNVKKVFIGGWEVIFPIFILLYLLLIIGSSAMKAAFWACAVIFVMSLIFKRRQMSINKWVEAFESAMKGLLIVALACATAGLVIGVFSQTGLGFKLSGFIISLARGNMFLLLLITGLMALLLSCGLPTSGAYIMLAVVVGPALIKFGIYPAAAHLFILYYCVLSNVTPPVCIASYTAAGIAGSDPIKTAMSGLKLSLVAFILPFAFVYNPMLLTVGFDYIEFLYIVINIIVGILALGFVLSGYVYVLNKRIDYLNRLLFLISAILFVNPAFRLLGFPMFMLAYAYSYLKEKYKQKAAIQ